MRILVTGASGFVGRHLVPALRRRGDEVLTLARGPAPAGSAGALAGPAELAGLGSWTGWPAGLDAVVHLAALNPGRRDPAWGDAAALGRANVLGAAALAARAAREGVPRLVHLSTAKIHGMPSEQPVTEATPLAPPDAYARSKAEGEAALRAALAGSSTRPVVLRPVPVFGPGGGGLVAGLDRLSRLPLRLPVAGIGAPRSLLSVGSLVVAIEAALAAPLAAGEGLDLLLADDGPLPPEAILAALRDGRDGRLRLSRLPFGLAGLARRAAGLAGVSGLLAPFVVDCARARARLDWRPREAAAELRAMAAAEIGNSRRG